MRQDSRSVVGTQNIIFNANAYAEILRRNVLSLGRDVNTGFHRHYDARFERAWTGLSNEGDSTPAVTPEVLQELRDARTELAAWLESLQRKQHV